MTVIDEADNPAPTRGSGECAAHISDETFTFRDVVFDDRKVTGLQIAEAAGAFPATDYVVLHQLETGETETIRPTELVDLNKPARLFVINGDGTARFFVNGLSVEWPRRAITGRAIKVLVGKDDDDLELVLERADQPDKVIEDDDEVRIGAPGVEKLYTRPAQISVTIIVNTRPKPWTKRRISFTQVVTLAYPTPPTGENLVFTVGYFDGPPGRPEGSLTEGESVRVRDGMVFDVKFTDKS